MPLPAIAAAAIGSGISRAPSLSNYGFQGLTTGNWGGTSKERKNLIHDQRFLRRREYQDMVHSLRQAGLNPMLAVGTSPGHSAAQQVQQSQGYGGDGSGGTAVAANEQARIRGELMPYEKELISANVTTAQAAAREKSAQAAIAELTLHDQQEAIRARAAHDRASAGLSNAREAYTEGPETRLAEARTQLAETERVLKDIQARAVGVVTPAQVASLMGAARLAASSHDLNEQNAARISYENVVKQIEAELRRTGVGENSLKFKMIMRDLYEAFAPFIGDRSERETTTSSTTSHDRHGSQTDTHTRTGRPRRR